MPLAVWLQSLFGIAAVPTEGEAVALGDATFVMRGGILRSSRLGSADQQQTSDTFGFKWHQRATFEGSQPLDHLRQWLVDRYGDVESYLPAGPFLLLDAGCGEGVLVEEYASRLAIEGIDENYS